MVSIGGPTPPTVAVPADQTPRPTIAIAIVVCRNSRDPSKGLETPTASGTLLVIAVSTQRAQCFWIQEYSFNQEIPNMIWGIFLIKGYGALGVGLAECTSSRRHQLL